MNLFENAIDATNFTTASYEYETEFKNLLTQIYKSHENMKNKEFKLPRKETEIRDKLVDDYLSKEIKNYKFKKEETINLGRVDIYIVNKLDDEKPHFVIECKLLENKNIDGVRGLNAEYVKNGIQRLITEYYKEGAFVNAMIGFIIDDLNEKECIKSINKLVENLLKNLIVVKKKISLEERNMYKSIYTTTASGTKDHIIYHLMMDFSKNII